VWQDYFYRHTVTPSTDDIVIIKIDEKTLNELQAKNTLKTLSIPKGTYATLIEKLQSAWVKGIAFDIIFQNADSEEEKLADTMKRYQNIVIAMMSYRWWECVPDIVGSWITCPGVPRSVYNDTLWWSVDMETAYSRALQVDISGDSIPYRSWKIWTGASIKLEDTRIHSLPVALWRQLHTGSMVMPTRENIYLNPYFGPPNAYPSISFVDVLDMSRLDLIRTFAGKYVFIWESWTAIHDAIISPVTWTMMDGVESHAHFLDGLLQNKMLKKFNQDIGFVVIIVLTLVSTVLYFYIPKYLSPIFAIVAVCLILYISRYTYDIARTVVDIFLLFLAGGVITYPVTYMYRFFVVEREKRELQNNFGHYIDPHVVEEIANRGEEIQLGGERRVLSVLFSDIAGFTTISESMNPQELFYLMTSYLSNMTDILIERWGTLDKYIGDAVMGFFWAPLSYEDHAVRAADTALRMRSRLPAFNDDLIVHGMKPIDFRVGIATGEVMVGNIGSHDRFNYTVLGDTVNLASRLEWTGKEYDVHIIVPEATKQALGSAYLTRELDTIAVKWKTEWVRIYELIGYADEIQDTILYTNYQEALDLYRKWDYRSAGKIWQKQAQDDPPSRVMMLRCLEILKGNVHVENGVYHMTHK
jgi:adenylate cyclase